MRRPKGFGKNYFSLSAICAYSSAAVLHAQCTSFTQSSRNISFETLEEEDDPLEELELLQTSSFTSKTSSCHCNCYFKRLVYTLTQFLKFQIQTFFIYLNTRSGISPPSFDFQLIHNNKII